MMADDVDSSLSLCLSLSLSLSLSVCLSVCLSLLMMADDVDSFSNDLAKMGNQEGCSIFPKSNYQHDGPLPAGQPIHHSHRID